MTVHIGIDYTSAIHQSAGIGRYTREIVKAIARQTGANLSYNLFVADAGPNFARPLPGPNFCWRPTRLTERWLARLWFRLRLPLPIEIWTGPVALFHAPDFFLPPVKRATRTIVTVHDLSFVREPDSIMPGMANHLNKWVPNSVKRADRVVADSEATRRDLIELYHTPPEKICVIYPGVGPEFQPIDDPALLRGVRQKYRLGSRPFILSVGTIQPRKNYLRLIRAFANIDPRFSLVLAGGRGWDSDNIHREIDNLGLENRVYLPGFIADADLPALYSAADLFVYPSLYEGFGLPVLEAMACGTPVVASNRSSLPEVAGQAGLLLEPEDTPAWQAAIAQLLSHPQQQQAMAVAGQKQAAGFTWQATARNLTSLYLKMIEAN